MGFVTVALLFFMTFICHSQEHVDNIAIKNQNNTNVVLSDFEKEWQKYYQPTKECDEDFIKYRNKDFKLFIKCNALKRAERDKFELLYKQKLADKVALKNDRDKSLRLKAEQEANQARVNSGHTNLKSKHDYIASSSALCSKRWKKKGVLNSQMFTRCFNVQLDSYKELKDIHNNYSDKPFYYKIAYPYCNNRWIENNITDIQLLTHCLKDEIEGKKDVDHFRTQYDSYTIDTMVLEALILYESWEKAAYSIAQSLDES